MRLSKAQIDMIRKTASQNFGKDALIWFCGLRLDDSRRGGDVDLYVETTRQDTLKSDMIACKALAFLFLLKEKNYEYQIVRLE